MRIAIIFFVLTVLVSVPTIPTLGCQLSAGAESATFVTPVKTSNNYQAAEPYTGFQAQVVAAAQKYIQGELRIVGAPELNKSAHHRAFAHPRAYEIYSGYWSGKHSETYSLIQNAIASTSLVVIREFSPRELRSVKRVVNYRLDPQVWYYKGLIEFHNGQQASAIESFAVAIVTHNLSSNEQHRRSIGRSLERFQGDMRLNLTNCYYKIQPSLVLLMPEELRNDSEDKEKQVAEINSVAATDKK